MATLTVDKPAAEAKARVMEAVEDAKRAVVRGKHQFEDLRDATSYRIKKAPLASVGIGFAAGVALGALIAVIVGNTSKKKVTL
jgi:ElaB/YqjD/DUF883 family membrane-anchored ribosome-binding protein